MSHIAVPERVFTLSADVMASLNFLWHQTLLLWLWTCLEF